MAATERLRVLYRRTLPAHPVTLTVLREESTQASGVFFAALRGEIVRRQKSPPMPAEKHGAPSPIPGLYHSPIGGLHPATRLRNLLRRLLKNVLSLR